MVKRKKILEHTVIYMYIYMSVFTMRGDTTTGKRELAQGKGVHMYFFIDVYVYGEMEKSPIYPHMPFKTMPPEIDRGRRSEREKNK